MNARYVQKLGCGQWATTLEDASVLHAFASRLSRCEERLASYHQDGNQALLTALDARLVA